MKKSKFKKSLIPQKIIYMKYKEKDVLEFSYNTASLFRIFTIMRRLFK
jgi:hypothetical protein